MGVIGFGLARWLGQYAFPYFPRRVLIETHDLIQLAFTVVTISVLASLLGIWKALRVEPNSVLA
jgi:putative ABC transport system permease protein